MSHFEICLGFVLSREAGLVEHPQDPGGLTNFGISQRAYPQLDIRDLTVEQAAEIYRRDYWRRVRGDDLPPGIAALVFDDAVNCGRRGAIRRLQQVLKVPDDGLLGPITLAAAGRRRFDRAVLARLAARRMVHYAELSTFAAFGDGWSDRLMACLVFALDLQKDDLP